MTFRLQAYVLFIVALAITALATLRYDTLAALPSAELTGLFTLFVLALLAEAVSLNYVVNGKAFSSSISFIPLFAIATLFGPPAATLATLALIGIAEFGLRKKSFLIALFNTAQGVIAIRVGSWLFEVSAAAQVGTPLSVVVGFAGLTIGFFATNLLSVATFVIIRDVVSFSQSLRSISQSGTFDLAYDLLVSPVALIIHYLYADAWILGVVVVILPLFIIRHSYFSKLQLQQANTALLKVLIKAIETRDPYTSGHSVRVARVAKLIGEDSGLRGKQLEALETAALLHDIGKVDGTYAELIRKPSSLTDSEVQVIRTHATRGADFLASLTIFERDMIDAVRHHHERYDGSGYPDRLCGPEIPLFSRIIQIADSVDAMLSDRPYRKALSVAHVYEELRRCASSQFDPELVSQMEAADTLSRVEGGSSEVPYQQHLTLQQASLA